MMYKISCVSDQLVLTLVPDESINAGKLHHAESFLNHAMSTSITCLIVDFHKITSLTPTGCWTMFQMACLAHERGKQVFLYRVHASLLPVLQETDFLSLAGLIEKEKELSQAIREKSPSSAPPQAFTSRRKPRIVNSAVLAAEVPA